jgi:hypothetical protein
MAAKFIVVNNGLKDLRGHYFETSVSVAEAARASGFTPILAAHVTCPARLIPSWLEFYPLFCTDHWMSAPAAPPPCLGGILGDPAALARRPLDGPESLGDYLRARFEPVVFPELPEPPPAEPAPPPIATAVTAPPARGWKASVKRVLRAAVPPALAPLLRRLWRGKRAPLRLGKRALRAGLPPAAFVGLRSLYRRIRPRPAPPALPDPAADLAPVEAAPPPVEPSPEPLAAWLARIGAPEEFDHVCAFQRDLMRLLCLTGAGRDDHIFMPTAHARELLAIQRILATLPEEVTPTFHLEFRHALDMGATPENPDFEHPYVTCHRAYFDFSRRELPPARVRLYTDTDELSEAYREFSGLEFATLPIPFRTHLVTSRAREPGKRLCVAFFGDVRDEKRFYWLPELVEALTADYLVPGKVRFLFQATLVQPEWNPASHRALLRLKEMPPEHVRLVGLDGPLSPDEYYRLFAEADLLLCAYDPVAYNRRSSGTLTEAVAAGIPTVVPEGTWLERHQPPSTGEGCADLPSFLQAVRRICDNYPAYLKQARAAKDRWLSVHTPLNLVRALLGPEAPEAYAARAA